jgi:hypothetical protein
MLKYSAYWLYWKKCVKTRPVYLPDVIQTRFISERALDLPGLDDYVIRVAAVTAPGSGLLDIDEDRLPRPRQPRG